MTALQKFIDKITPNRILRIFLVYAVVVISLAIFFYWWGEKQTERVLVEQMLHRETVLVREGAGEMTRYFQDQENRVLFLAELLSLVKPDNQQTAKILKEKLVRLPSPGVDIIRVDKTGRVVARGSGLSEITDISDRDYFLWAKEKENHGQVFYSQIAVARGGPAKDQKAFALATPVYQDDQFAGLVAIIISMPELVKTYVVPLAVTENSSSFLVFGGRVLFMAEGKFSEASIEELIEGEALEKIKKGEDGKAVVTTRLVAFTPVKLGDNLIWSLGTTVPQKEALVFLGPFRQHQVAGLVFSLLSVLAVSILFVFGLRLAQRQGFFDGLRDGKG